MTPEQARALAGSYYQDNSQEEMSDRTSIAKSDSLEIPSWEQIAETYTEDPAAFQKGLISSLRRPKDPIWSDEIGQNLEMARKYPPNKLWNAYIGGGQLRSDTESWNARNAPNDEVWAYMMQAVQPEQRQDALKYRGNQPAPTTMQVPKYSDPQGGWVSKEQVTVPDYSKKESSEEEEKN